MPSSLTWFLSRTLVCSTHPPVSVCGTGRRAPTLRRLFSASVERGSLRVSSPLPLARPPQPTGGPATRPRHRLRSRAGRRNVRLLSIGYALRPRLRSRLTLGGRTWPRNPWICGGRDSHPPFRYSCLHGRSHALHVPSRGRFDARATLSYQMYYVQVRGFGCPLESRSFSARSLSASELLRNLQMMAASKPTSWLSMKLHILTIH